MAESKDYSVEGGGKKILFIIALLVFIAVVVTAIILLIPANQYTMVDALQENHQTFFLKDENEQAKYQNFTDKIKANTSINYYADEIDDIPVIALSVSHVLAYYNDYMVFAENNKVMSNNSKTIKNKLEQSVILQENLDNILDEASKLDADSVSFLQNAWIDFRIQFNDYVKCYYDLFEALKNCYEGCFDMTLSNNKASHHILNAVDDYISCINSDLSVLINVDRKGSIEQGNYMYKSKAKVACFDAFVTKCVVNNKEIIYYLSNASFQQKYQKLDRFLEVYGESDYKAMINSIYPTQITKSYQRLRNV